MKKSSISSTHGLRNQQPCLRITSGVLLAVLMWGLSAGCSTMPNPAKRLVNHVSTKASEVRLRDKVEKDSFPTAKEAGLD